MRSYKSGESIRPYFFSYMVLRSSLLQPMALDHLQVVRQPARICRNPSARLFATWDMAVLVKPSDCIGAELPIDTQLVLPARFRVISANVSCRLFAANDGVKSSVPFWAKFPVGVQLDLPTRFRVLLANVSFGGLFAASDEVRSSGHIWAKSANCVQLVWPARFRVNPYNALEWVNQYAIHFQVN